MEKGQYYSKLDEIISKFEDGANRYKTNAMVSQCVNLLARGADPISIIDMLCKINSDHVAQMMKFIEKYPMHNVIK